MAFEVTTIDDCADEETFLRFALVPCASGPSGATAPIITFHRAQPDADRPVGDYVGLCVTPAYLEHVVSSCAGPPIFHGGLADQIRFRFTCTPTEMSVGFRPLIFLARDDSSSGRLLRSRPALS